MSLNNNDVAGAETGNVILQSKKLSPQWIVRWEQEVFERMAKVPVTAIPPRGG